jgi:hypothetical protein
LTPECIDGKESIATPGISGSDGFICQSFANVPTTAIIGMCTQSTAVPKAGFGFINTNYAEDCGSIGGDGDDGIRDRIEGVYIIMLK